MNSKSWAVDHIAKLLAGETLQFRAYGHSMSGRIDSGDLVTVEPVTDAAMLMVGEIVLCKVRRSAYLHLIKAKRRHRFQIGNNLGGINGWISADNIFGRVASIEKAPAPDVPRSPIEEGWGAPTQGRRA